MQPSAPSCDANSKYLENRKPHDTVAWPLWPQIHGSALRYNLNKLQYEWEVSISKVKFGKK